MGSTTSKASQGSQAAAEAVQGSHVFQISGYSERRERRGGYGESPVFAFCGYDWQIQYHLEGTMSDIDDVAVFLLLLKKNDDACRDTAVASVRVQLRFVDVTGSSPHHTLMTKEFDSGGRNYNMTGRYKFMKRSDLEASPYLRDNRLTIECLVTIIKEPPVDVTTALRTRFAEVPPSNITEHLEKLLRGKEGADVVFMVGREGFPAHKTVLAMRSPVFKAELYGARREYGTSRITIRDMQPAVFEALLHFIYTDSLPPVVDREMTRHLLAAAYRYAVERLKIICESIVCENLDVKTVMTTLALAHQHHCGRLKDACIKFIAYLGTKETDGVMASKGYVDLKATSPSALVELWEETSRIRNSKCTVGCCFFNKRPA